MKPRAHVSSINSWVASDAWTPTLDKPPLGSAQAPRAGSSLISHLMSVGTRFPPFTPNTTTATAQQSLPPGGKGELSAEKYEDVHRLILSSLSLSFCFFLCFVPWIWRKKAWNGSLGIFFFLFPPFICAHWLFISPLCHIGSLLAGLQKTLGCSVIIKAYWSENKWHHCCLFISLHSCESRASFWCFDNSMMCPHSICLCVCVCVFSLQHALRLLAFGQLYKVLNMDPLPASKSSPRLLEGVSSVVSVFVFHVNLFVCMLCLCVYVHHFCCHLCVSMCVCMSGWLFLSPDCSCIFASL